MNRVEEAYKQIEEFEQMAEEVGLEGPNLQQFTKLMSRPNYGTLRLFLAIGEEKSPTAQWMADFKYSDRAGHTCYRNDSFCVAHLFDLDSGRKRESSKWVIENGMGSYFEPVTHGGFRLSDLLCKMGAMESPVSGDGYVALGHDRIVKMAEALGVTNDELAGCAENVVKWILNEGYKVDDAETTFSAGTPLRMSQAEKLERSYLSQERQELLRPLFIKARVNEREGKVKWFNDDLVRV